MSKDAGIFLKRLRVDGGASNNELLMQYQADVCGIPIDRPKNIETTALGAAYLAGLAVGVFADTSAIVKAHQIDKSFEVKMSKEERATHRARWNDAIERTSSQAKRS